MVLQFITFKQLLHRAEMVRPHNDFSSFFGSIFPHVLHHCREHLSSAPFVTSCKKLFAKIFALCMFFMFSLFILSVSSLTGLCSSLSFFPFKWSLFSRLPNCVTEYVSDCGSLATAPQQHCHQVWPFSTSSIVLFYLCKQKTPCKDQGKTKFTFTITDLWGSVRHSVRVQVWTVLQTDMHGLIWEVKVHTDPKKSKFYLVNSSQF